jgi:hypothetical protein
MPSATARSFTAWEFSHDRKEGFLMRRSVNVANSQWSNLTGTTLAVCFLLSGVIVRADSCLVTNEADAFAILTSAWMTNGRVTLSWESCNEHLYEVQTSEAPSAPNVWAACALMIGGDGSTSWTDTTALAQAQRFYRVQRLRFGGDEDGDGLSNWDEFNRGTDLRNPDTDGDGMSDGWEVQHGFDPLDPEDAHGDLDGDGYTNLQEYQLHTKPEVAYSNPAQFPRGLVAWWKLDEGMGTNVFDSSLNRHHGFVRGGSPAESWTSGYFSNAVTLGGPSNNWIEVAYHPSLVPTEELTLTGWVKPFGQGILIGNWDSAGQVYGNYRLQFGPDQIELRFSPAGNGSYQTVHFNPNWTTNEWHHVAVSYGGDNLAVFVDGELRDSRIVTGLLSPVPNPILIGFPGIAEASAVDDVRLYHRALGTNEIAGLSRGNGLPVSMIVGQTATLRAFGASESDTCQWFVVSGNGFFTNTLNCTTDFRPSWSGAVTVQVVVASSGVLRTNRCRTVVAFPSLSPLSEWNDDGNVQQHNNCYNYATDIRTDHFSQPGGGSGYECQSMTSGALSDGLQAGVDLADLCHTSGLPQGHIVALLVWPGIDFHFARLEADGTWSNKGGPYPASTTDYSWQPILDPRTADFGDYGFCGFFWVGPDVHIH